MQSNAIFKPKIQKHMTCLDYRLGDDLVQTLLRSILGEDLIKLVGFRGPVVFLQLQLLTLQISKELYSMMVVMLITKSGRIQ
jgi:hypothetical protein